MQADPRFRSKGFEFWANVRTISEQCGYTSQATATKPRAIRIHTIHDMGKAIAKADLMSDHLVDPQSGKPSQLALDLQDYFAYRAQVLVNQVQPNLMCKQCARRTFLQLQAQLGSTRPVPLNKQSQQKKQPLYLTGIVNMLVEHAIGTRPCDYDPNGLTSFTRSGAPVRTLSRRHDGAFPRKNDPIAIWEVKEYCYTTTFGSKISDGVYITQLDGLEVEEARAAGIDVQFVLMVDAYETWWLKGVSYLCRLIDLLHMGYVDEILFGSELLARLPIIVKDWVAAYDAGAQISSLPVAPNTSTAIP
jgi:hypothetical protein